MIKAARTVSVNAEVASLNDWTDEIISKLENVQDYRERQVLLAEALEKIDTLPTPARAAAMERLRNGLNNPAWLH